jgi:chromosomal replication initiation ATPase DnaA
MADTETFFISHDPLDGSPLPAPPIDLVIPTPRDITRGIIREVAQKHGLTVAEMMIRSRKQRIAHARQEAYFRIRTERKYTLHQVAAIFGDLDHATVIYGVRAHARRMADQQSTETRKEAA